MRVVSVIIASLGPECLNRMGFERVDSNYNYSPKIAELNTYGGHETTPEKIFSADLVNTATQLHQHRIRLSCLLQLLGLGGPAQNCVRRPSILSLEASNSIVKYKDYQSRMQPCGTQVLSLIRRVPFLRVIDTEQVFCSAGCCAGFIVYQLLYTDNNHLKVAGSRGLVPLILKAALEWVGQAK